MNLEAAPLYRGDQSRGRGNVVRKVLEFSEQALNRILEFVDTVPRRELGSFKECGLERPQGCADIFERGADFDGAKGRVLGRRV